MLPIATRTRHGPKPFAWSWSKIKNYETCPKRHYHVDIKKDFSEDKSNNEQLKRGDIVHKVMEQRLRNGTALPPVHEPMLEPWAQWLLEGDGQLLVELQLAITKDKKACQWFGPDAWFRARIDALKLNAPVAIIVDWKTGKPKDDTAQLMLNAAAAFYHYPELQAIKSYFVWLDHNMEDNVLLTRSKLPEVWSWIWPRVEELREAYEAEVYEPKPSYLCQNYCPVAICPYFGRKQ